MKRLFIGLELKASTKNYLHHCQDKLKSTVKKAQWIESTNFHVTLKYLGPTDNLDAIADTLSDQFKNIEPFTFTIDTVETFKRGQRHIIWAGSKNKNKPLLALVNQLETAMQRMGFSKETRPYTLHITLARDAILTEVLDLPIYHTIHVRALTLFESHRVNGKLTYTQRSKHVLE